jgi:ABC-2 type transport system permease protein
VIMSGYIVPLAYMPRAAQLGSALVPLRYYIVITRGIFLKGSTLGDLWPQVGALAALGVLLFGLAAARFRRGLE